MASSWKDSWGPSWGPSWGAIGLSVPQAISALINANFIVGVPITYVFSNTVPYNYVISQTPVGNASVPWQTSVYLTASAGPKTLVGNVIVPFVTNLAYLDAERLIYLSGVNLKGTSYLLSNTVPQGAVISQSLVAGSQVPPGTAMTLVMSMGADPGYPSKKNAIVPLVT